MNSTSEVLIVAAEASSSLYAQRLLEHWQKAGRDVRAFGIGSRDMEKLGFEILGRSEEMAVVGLQEVLAHWSEISGVFHEVVRQAAARKPQVALLMDYPGFNLRLAKKLKELGIKVVYYISPQVWAWRTGRVKHIRKYVDHMLVLFPFEEEFYRQHDVRADFVGHPLLDELSEDWFDEERRHDQRQRFGLGEDDIVLGLMPGSRRSEIKHHLQTQLQAAERLVRAHSNVKVVLLVAPTLDRDELRQQLGDLKFPIQMIKESPFDMIHLTDIVLVASGTATLMVGLMEKPMVVMYRMNGLTAFLAKRLVRHTAFFAMVNLIMEREVAPEYFQEQANPEQLARVLGEFVDNPERRHQVREELRTLKSRLGQNGATENVARIVEGYLWPS